MKVLPKVLSVILLGLILLSACGAVTPVPTATSTLTLRPTVTHAPVQTPTKKITPTATATPIPLTGPTLDPENYSLRSRGLTADEQQSVLDKTSEYRPFLLDQFEYWKKYSATFDAERWLRASLQDKESLAWEIAYNNPSGIPLPGMRPNEDLFAFLVAGLLNNKGVQLESLSDSLLTMGEERFGYYGGFIIADPSYGGNSVVIKNLFGDGQDAFVFVVRHSEDKIAVFAIRIANGIYQVDKIRDWEQFSWPGASNYYRLFAVQDANGNGLPEVGVSVRFGASGLPQTWGEQLTLYEWNPSLKMFRDSTLKIFSQTCNEGPCIDNSYQWEFVPIDASGQKHLVVKESHFSQIDELEYQQCSNLIVQRTYLWVDHEFYEQSEAYLPPNDELPECQLAWAHEVLTQPRGWQSDLAVEIISTALNSWPEGVNDFWGPASKDYFRFKLSLALDLRGEKDRVTELLQILASNAEDPRYPLVSKLSSVYLDERSRYGVLQACGALKLLQVETISETFPMSIYFSLDELWDSWGFGNLLWSYKIEDWCNYDNTLQSLALAVNISNVDDLSGWLTTIGFMWSDIQQVDFTDAGVRAWLVTKPGSEDTNQNIDDGLWLFTRTGHGLQAAKLIESWRENVDIIPVPEVYSYGSFMIVKFGDYIEMVQVYPDGHLKILAQDYWVKDFQVVPDAKQVFFVVESGWGGDVKEMFSYTWSEDEDRFIRDKVGYNFELVKLEAETLLFQQQDYASAVLFINKFLFEAPPERIPAEYCLWRECQPYPDWYRPYLRYLLGIAYEMVYQPDRAKLVYYTLWQDYPTNVFGVAASLKLEPVSP